MVAASLVESDRVKDMDVIVLPGLFHVRVELAANTPEDAAWLGGVMAAGQRVQGVGAAKLKTVMENALEVYRTKEGVKHFRGYSWSVYGKPRRSKRQKGKGKITLK